MARKGGREPVKAGRESACENCGSLCCRYIAIQIQAPRDRDEYDLIRWFLAHGGVCVYIDAENDWMVQVPTPCKHLVSHRCAIYPRRPRVCREYGTHACETAAHSEENVAEFGSAEEFEGFFRRNFRFQGSSARRKHRTWRTGAT